MVCLAIFTAVAFFLEYHQNNKLNEAQFVIELNNQFFNEGKMPTVEFDLERYFVAKKKENVAAELRAKYGPDNEAHQDLVNYLVHLEGIADLVNNGMLWISSIHDLMAYRFFIAVNNSVMRELELDEFPEYYQDIHALYPVWKKLMARKKVSIPLE